MMHQQDIDEPVRQYVEDKTRLWKRADPGMDEEVLFHHLFHGLKPDLASRVAGFPMQNAQQLVTSVATIEHDIKWNRERLSKQIGKFRDAWLDQSRPQVAESSQKVGKPSSNASGEQSLNVDCAKSNRYV